ncbi:hypothetical protein A3F65_00385 [Candidatus Saccharibacteria bacterium RIFCSPHIGHO2_12_FULL_47_16b]|nr:MAG: hypothetical protein A3F65_00385 [Candidatus Saccharibacteria bacterium RIFCSPHIGHO2_12_FULL_47_16b]OGL38100.1 MAG: hypothetical protein A3J32_03285 [Candidatus Saccharibacteria bacterium RIFCSPLOWO2_02_FULL_46_7]
MQIFIAILGFILFIGLILVHEWGHYLAARRSGVEVEEFGLGLPPRAYDKKTKSGMLLSLNWLPLGGFVKLKGEHDSDREKGSFGAASFGAKTKIMLAGVVMNLLAGLILLTLLAFIGIPKLINQETVGQAQFTVKSDERLVSSQAMVYYVVADSPAQSAGLKERDILETISTDSESRTIKNAQDLKAATTHFAGQTVTITLKRSGQEQKVQAKLLSPSEAMQGSGTDKPYLGIAPTSLEVVRYTWSAPIVAVGFTNQLMVLTAKGLWHAVEGLGSTIAGLVTGNETARQKGQTQASSQVGGPVAIMVAIWNSGSLGLNFLLMFVSIISLSLAFINILPIPALDGGRLFIISATRALRIRLSAGAEELINGIGITLILLLAVLITVVDVRRFF